jgi:tetratricopeptide (TPR) repeat protein
MLYKIKTLFGISEEQKINRAKKYVEQGQFNNARMEIFEITSSEASEILEKANMGLSQINIQEAQARFNSGDFLGAQEHLELARKFGASEEDIRVARKLGRQRKQEAENESKQLKAQRNKIEVVGDDPVWSLPPDHPHVRYAIKIKEYPNNVQKRLINLGSGFAEASLLLDDGHYQLAYEQLTTFVEQEPAARYERAKAALQLQQIDLAIGDLIIFGEKIGHCVIEGNHTAALLSQLLKVTNRTQEALQTLSDSNTKHPSALLVRAEIEESRGRFKKAQDIIKNLLQQFPSDLNLIRRLAHLKVKNDERPEATQILESALQRCCAPGKCGSQPFDVFSARLLVRIYLEDRVDEKRSKELLKEIQKNSREITWEDQYLSALYARNTNQPYTTELAQKLLLQLSEHDPRRQWVSSSFSLSF